MADEFEEPVTPDPKAVSPVYTSSSEPYGQEPEASPALTSAPASVEVAVAPPSPPAPIPPPPPPPPSSDDEEEEDGDEEDKGMLRMSFMEHLEELRTRILRALIGI